MLSIFVTVLFLVVIARMLLDLCLWLSDEDAMEVIANMLQQGYELSCGCHRGRGGYFAAFFVDEPDGEYAFWDTPGPDWWEAGHANNLSAAIVMAAQIAREESVIIPSPEDF